MHDVIGAYERLDRLYRLYIKSAFPLRSSVLANERDALLKGSEVLSQMPLVETVPIYPLSSLTLPAAEQQLPSDYSGLAALAQPLFPSGAKLYQHQWGSLRQVILEQRDLVVTTGTGSGKTECFLLPLLAQLARESRTWSAPNPEPPNHRWWASSTGARWTSQLGHITRPSAVRAIVLYPLNALVEDQLRRLRSALDSEPVHHWLDRQRKGNRITFGRYTRLTQLAGPADDPQRQGRLAQHLRELEQQRQQVLEAQQQSAENTDLQYYFPRLDGGEMWSRWDMQANPPDILITNYSMLNIMLMRSIEDNIFETTRAWLSEDGHPERQFFLIVDELHAYRGTPGTEVAYILRLLLSRLGLTPDSPKLRILTTTASLDEDDRGRRFLKEFFGRSSFGAPDFRFVSGEQIPPEQGARTRLAAYQDAFTDFGQAVQPDPVRGAPDGDDTSVLTRMNELAGRLGQPAERNQAAEVRLGMALLHVRAPDALRDACREVNKSVRATRADELDAQLFPGGAKGTRDADQIVSPAMRGLMLALGMARDPATDRSPQAVRGHFFYHNLQNLWVCSDHACTAPGCNDARQSSAEDAQRPTVGALHSTHRLTCECGARVLDFLVCEVCGDVFLGGYKAARKGGAQALIVLTPDQPDLASIPDRVDLSQHHGQYAVFWPLPHDPQPWVTAPQKPSWTVDKVPRRWVKAKLDTTSGLLIQNSTPPADSQVAGWLYHVVGSAADMQSALPTKCPRCDADYHSRKTFKSPLRNHRTGFQKACQVLASVLFREMEDDRKGQDTATSRKLVIFSDSRQDAAKLAAGMERDHYRDMVRLAFIRAFREYWGAFAAFLRRRLARHDEQLLTLQALNPALHAEATKPAEQDDAVRSRRFQLGHPKDLVNTALDWIMGEPATQPELDDDWLRLLQAYPGRVPVRYLMGTAFDALIRLGMCPGGAGYLATHYRTGREDTQNRRPWYECYDWKQDSPSPRATAIAEQSQHIAYLHALLTGELMYALFPHMARTLEGLGQGWISYRPQNNPSPLLVHTVDAVIRQMGTRRLHTFSLGYRPGANNTLRTFVLPYINGRGFIEPDVQQQLLQSSAGSASESGLVLNPDRLTLEPV